MSPTQGHLCNLLTGLETSSPYSQQNALPSLIFKENPAIQLVCKMKILNLKIFTYWLCLTQSSLVCDISAFLGRHTTQTKH